jgi:hypothetical protein
MRRGTHYIRQPLRAMALDTREVIALRLGGPVLDGSSPALGNRWDRRRSWVSAGVRSITRSPKGIWTAG